MIIAQNSKSKFKYQKYFSYSATSNQFGIATGFPTAGMYSFLWNFIADGVFRFSSPVVGLPFYRRKVILQTEKFRFNFKHPLHHFPFKSLPIKAKVYIPSTLNMDLILWHTQLIVCVLAYLNFIFEF